MTFTCVETGLPPQTMLRLHSASSRGLGPIGPPGTPIKLFWTSSVQIFAARPEYRI